MPSTGAILNPLTHQGQIDGSVAMGFGYGLVENLAYDESGKVLPWDGTTIGEEHRLMTFAEFNQLIGVGVAAVYSIVVTFVLLKILDKTIGLRADELID